MCFATPLMRQVALMEVPSTRAAITATPRSVCSRLICKYLIYESYKYDTMQSREISCKIIQK